MNKYQDYIDDYVSEMKDQLKDNLCLLLIIGSSSSSEVIENWSDIDSIVVLKKYDFAILEVIKKISNSFPVKIGTTIYDKREFEEKNIDPKTIYHLYLLKNNVINLQYIKSKVKIPEIDFTDIVNSHIPYLYWRIHIYKRNFLYDKLEKEQVKGLFKTTYLIMKAILILDGEYPRNYRDVFSNFSKKYDFEYYDFEKFIVNYTNDDKEYNDIIDYAKKFITYVIKRY